MPAATKIAERHPNRDREEILELRNYAFGAFLLWEHISEDWRKPGDREKMGFGLQWLDGIEED
jgi:hypothetical protein